MIQILSFIIKYFFKNFSFALLYFPRVLKQGEKVNQINYQKRIRKLVHDLRSAIQPLQLICDDLYEEELNSTITSMTLKKIDLLVQSYINEEPNLINQIKANN